LEKVEIGWGGHEIDRDASEALGSMVSTAPVLRELKLTCKMDAEVTCHLLNGLESDTCALKMFHLDGATVGETGVTALTSALNRRNNSVVDLILDGNTLGSEGASAIATILLMNANDVLKTTQSVTTAQIASLSP